MSHHDETTSTLNTLIATLIDSIDGYEKSAKEVENPRYAHMFAARAEERQRAVTQLQTAVTAIGGSPKEQGSVLGALHRAFETLREVVSTKDDAAIIAEIEHGEDYLKDKFETALDSSTLAAAPRAAVEAAWASVKAGHDEMSQLKHTVNA